MEQGNIQISKFFVTSLVEKRDEYDEKLDRCYNLLQNLTSGLSDKEANDALNSAISKDARNHDDICLGLLVVILTEPQNAVKSYRDLTLVSRDGMATVLANLSLITQERFLKVKDLARQQVLWLVREMIKNGVNNMDGICWNLMRNIAGGDVSVRNLTLAETLLDIYMECRTWLEKTPQIVPAVVYTYLRLIEDHISPQLTPLRQKEVTFTVSLLRDKFHECLSIGRDLARVLQNVARIPEFEELWKDIHNSPRSLSPNFSGILQLLQTRTSRKYLISRLTPDMERKIAFLTNSVRFGMHKRYQDWFQRQYLHTVESHSLRCDIIRFIVGVIHPSNELLCSDIMPRWAVIGWLLTTCTAPVAAANAKLALFYDWLFFEADRDNIMNIEPAILVMYHSLRSHPAVTATLLDFLCRIIPNFCPSLTDKVQAGIFSSLRQILDKRVLQTLQPILDNPKMDRDLRIMVRESFKDFIHPSPADGKLTKCALGQGRTTWLHAAGKGDEFGGTGPAIKDESSPHDPSNNHENEPVFSDDDTEGEEDDDIPLAQVKLNKDKPSPTPGNDLTSMLDGEMKVAVEALNVEDKEEQCAAMERLVQLMSQEEVDEETTAALATCLCAIMKDQFRAKVLPDEITEETLEDSIGRPLFVIFRNLVQMQDMQESSRRPILRVLVDMAQQEPRLGYLLLYFLGACKLESGKAAVYKEYCKTMPKELEECLLADLKVCQEEEVPLFCWVVPEVYQLFPAVAQGHAQLLHLLLEAVDAAQMQHLICHVLQGKLIIFKNETFLSLLQESLEWETFEQCCLWHLIEAHNIPVDQIMPILPKLEFRCHAEALSSIMLFLKQERPTVDLVKNLLCREVKIHDYFVVSLLKYWALDYEEKLADIMAGLLNKHSCTSPNKRKRGGSAAGGANKAGPGPPSLEQVLAHLDQLRQFSKHSPHFFLLDSMQRGLQQVAVACSDSQKKRFGDLLALAEDLCPRGSGTMGRGTRKAASSAKAAAKSQSRVVKEIISESSEDSSEEEEIIKPKPAKKRKKANPVNSDSD